MMKKSGGVYTDHSFPVRALPGPLAVAAPTMHLQAMTKYLISFPSDALVLTDAEFPIVSADAHAVIEEARAAGVYVFGGGIAEQVAPVLVSADGSVSAEIYPGSGLTGGFTVLELPSREDAVEWASKIAAACRCAQELREFMYDPAS
ncbi:YciI family protein [Sphingopyxis sp. MG]|uniref:YciI family protein n=2 Tax=Sphingomonadaceae TaxID=41297 RepID=UPI000A5281A3|nr:transcription initiation protein [Sphingopyxis sp. MG]